MVITFSKLSKLYPPTISMFKTYYVCLRLFKLFSVNDKAKRKWDIFPDECCFWILLAESVYYAIKICLLSLSQGHPWPPITRLRDLQLPGSMISWFFMHSDLSVPSYPSSVRMFLWSLFAVPHIRSQFFSHPSDGTSDSLETICLCVPWALACSPLKKTFSLRYGQEFELA